jgi:hypothetical protein
VLVQSYGTVANQVQGPSSGLLGLTGNGRSAA